MRSEIVFCVYSSSAGFGRRVKVLRRPEKKTLPGVVPAFGRKMQETKMHYGDPGPNTNQWLKVHLYDG
ncbi:hypothetical protein HPP92_027585 [Vanilla planifolia]|uniref:Uncharacterized protein n=1 Tax=Vanilla planifolia TaxID=51239 RepID=A0A835U4Z7_VANPL|nr:hypothetical protein HPP92_027585 [Vanilla planifolia]